MEKEQQTEGEGKEKHDHVGVEQFARQGFYAHTTRDGRTIISRKPNFGNRQFSDARRNVRSRPKQTAEYTKVASRENPMYTQKAAVENGFHIAFCAWRRPPVIRVMIRDYRTDFLIIS